MADGQCLDTCILAKINRWSDPQEKTPSIPQPEDLKYNPYIGKPHGGLRRRFWQRMKDMTLTLSCSYIYSPGRWKGHLCRRSGTGTQLLKKPYCRAVMVPQPAYLLESLHKNILSYLVHTQEQESNRWLVGGFNPFEKYESKWKSSPKRGEIRNNLKPLCHQFVWSTTRERHERVALAKKLP